MNVIIFGHLERPGQWMAEQMDLQPGFHGAAVVTTGVEYVAAARALRDFSLLVGQYKLNEYQDAEKMLADEHIYPHRRVIVAPTITTQFLEWASEQFYDGVIDLIANPKGFGEEAAQLFTQDKGKGHANLRFPFTKNPSGLIPYRDSTDEDIVRLISAGLNNHEIAELVFLSVQTVRNRISRLLEASGARNRTHLCSMFLIPHTSNQFNEIHPTLSVDKNFPIERTDLSA